MELSGKQIRLLRKFVKAKRCGKESEVDDIEWDMLNNMVHPRIYNKAVEFSNTGYPLEYLEKFLSA